MEFDHAGRRHGLRFHSGRRDRLQNQGNGSVYGGKGFRYRVQFRSAQL